MRQFKNLSCGHVCPWAAIAVFLLLVVFAGTPADAAHGVAGFFGGINIANLGGDMKEFGDALAAELEMDPDVGGSWSSDKTTRTGFGLGGYYAVATSPTVSFQIEAQYIQRGSSFDLRGTSIPVVGSADVETKFKLDYIEIPVLARFTPSTSGSVRPIILVGPVVSFKTSANMEVSSMGESQSVDISDGMKGVTFGLLGGIGISIEAGATSAVVVQARYYLGLTNVFDESNFSAKSGDFGLFAGMEFKVGQESSPAPSTQ